MTNNSNIYNNSFNGMNSIHEDNNELSMHSHPHSTDTFSAFNTPFTLPSNKTSDILNSTPKTPTTNSTNIQSPWNQSPAITNSSNTNTNTNSNHTMSSSKIVNTGKNYILGGHNRIKNNSRAQSIHIDQFQDTI